MGRDITHSLVPFVVYQDIWGPSLICPGTPQLVWPLSLGQTEMAFCFLINSSCFRFIIADCKPRKPLNLSRKQQIWDLIFKKRLLLKIVCLPPLFHYSYEETLIGYSLLSSASTAQPSASFWGFCSGSFLAPTFKIECLDGDDNVLSRHS